MNDDDLKSMIESAGDAMPPDTKASIASAISAGFRADGPTQRSSSDAESVVVPLEAGGRAPGRTPKRWIAIGGIVPLAAALIGVFALRNDHDVAQVTDTVPVETTTTSTLASTATTEAMTPTTEVQTTETPTTGTPTTETPTTDEAATTETTTVDTSTPVTIDPSAALSPLGVPEDITPYSVSFGTNADGWMVGWAGEDNQHPLLLHTADFGEHWTRVAVPAALTASGGFFDVNFADSTNGWLLGAGADFMNTVFATHDGGATWQPAQLPAGGGSIEPMFAANWAGFVHIAAFVTDPDGAVSLRVLTSPVGFDEFATSPAAIQPGAGPVFDAHAAFAANEAFGNTGWIVYNDRGYTGGARLVGGQWVDWTAPCHGEDATIAAATDASSLVVGCSTTGFAGVPAAIRLHRSVDGGATFTETAPLPGSSQTAQTGSLPGVSFIAVPSSETIVVGYTNAEGVYTVVRSADAGATWVEAPSAKAVGFPLAEKVLSTPEAIILIGSGVGASSTDAGATWTPARSVPVS